MSRWLPVNGWRRARAEVAGAWRSLRYDIDRLMADRAAGREAPRRVLAMAAFGVLALVGAVGCYVTVVHGLGPLLAEESAVTEPYPRVATAPRIPAPSTHLGVAPAKKAPRHRSPATTTTATSDRTRVHRARPHRSTSPPRPKLVARPAKTPATVPPARPAASPSTIAPSRSPRPSPSPSSSPSPSPSPSASEGRQPTVRVSGNDLADETPESPSPLPGWLDPLLSGHPGPFTRPGGGVPHPGGVPVRSKL